MVYDVLLGALAMTTALFLVDHARRRQLHLRWWQWTATIVGMAYALLVVDVFRSFLEEGSMRGAIVVGMLAGMVAVVWGVLLWRFVFDADPVRDKPEAAS